jgi:phage shock protein A
MANVNLIARLANLWSGFVSLWISDVEKKHPEIAYENAINSMISKYAKLKSATAAIIRRRDEINARVDERKRSLAQVSADLETALATNQDDLALVLLQKKNALDADLLEVSGEVQQAQTDSDDAKASLLSVKSEIEKLKAEKDRMLAKMNSAQARLRVQQQLDGLSVDAEVRALDNVREHIKNTIAEANLGKELNDSDLDVRLKNLQKQTGTITAQAQLDELKRKRAAQASATKNM